MTVKTKMPTNPSWAMVDRGRVRFYEHRRKLSQDYPKAKPIQAYVEDDIVVVESGDRKKRLMEYGKSPEEAIKDLHKILTK